MIRKDSAAAESAESKQLDKEQLDAQLATFARRCAAAEASCWNIAALWLGIKDKSIETPYNEDKLDDEAARRILAAIGKAKNDMTARLLAEADGLAAVTDWNRERLAAVDAWLSELLAGTQAVAVATVTEAAVAVASASLVTYGNILSFDGAASGVKNVGMSAEQLASWFQNTPLDGGTLKEWVDSAFSDGAKRSLLTTLQAGGLQGHGTGKMVKSVLETALLEGFSVTERQAVTLTRTFVQTANVQAMEAVYRKNSHIVKAMKWITALDNHVCPLCAALDGMEWALDEPMPPRPRHPGCRCVLVPVVQRDKLGVNDAQADAKVKPVMRRWVEREEGAIGAGGKRKVLNSGKMVGSYEDWWKTLPEAKQAVTFGPVRTRLLREGSIAWGDLLEKGSGRLRTLDELGYTLGGKEFYEEAKGGGLHGGFYVKNIILPDKQLKKGIKSLQKQVEFHTRCIENPVSKVHDFAERSDKYKKGVVNKWHMDISRQTAQMYILRGILTERGGKDE